MTAGFPLPDPADAVIAPFWEAAKAGELRLPRRLDDGRFDWYPSGVPVEWVSLPGTARLFSWAVVTRPLHPGYAGIAPYIAAIVEPDGAPGVRLVTRVLADPARLSMDMPLKVRFLDLGHPGPATGVIGPMFEPLEG